MAQFPYTVCFWNVRGLRSRGEETEVLAQWADICGFGETRLTAGVDYDLPGFKLYRNDTGSGVLLAVRACVPHRVFAVPTCPGVTTVAVQVWSSLGWVLVVALYVSGGFSGRDWEEWLRTLPQPVLLCGDFNAHHSLWGSRRHDRRGAVIAASLENHDLVMLNDGTSTFVRWYGGTLQESVLDLAVCSRSLSGHLAMAISDDLRGSDHLPILVGTALTGTLRGLRESVRSGRRADRSVPRVEGGKFGVFLQKWGLGQRRNRQMRRSSRSNPPWWTDDCSLAVRDRRQAYRRFRRNQQIDRWEDFRVKSRAAKKVIRAAKRSYGARLCALVGSSISLAEVWKRASPGTGSGAAVSWVFAEDGVTILRGKCCSGFPGYPCGVPHCGFGLGVK